MYPRGINVIGWAAWDNKVMESVGGEGCVKLWWEGEMEREISMWRDVGVDAVICALFARREGNPDVGDGVETRMSEMVVALLIEACWMLLLRSECFSTIRPLCTTS